MNEPSPPLRKFMFDQTFDHLTANFRSERGRPVTLKPEQLDQIKRDAFDEGFAAGSKVGHDKQLITQTEVLAKLEQQINLLIQENSQQNATKEKSVRQVVLAIARKVLPDFIARQGLTEIEALLNQVIGEMSHEPRLVVRVHESLFDAINKKITEISAKKAYNGQIVVLADAEVKSGDCRVEWADGGVERKPEEILNTALDIVHPETLPEANDRSPQPSPSQE